MHSSVEDFAQRKILVMPEDSFMTLNTLCDAAGKFEFEGLEPGRWTVQFDWQPSGGGGADWIEGFGRRSPRDIELRDGETTHVVLGGPLEGSVRVFGRVTDGGEACASYIIYVSPETNTTKKAAAMPLNITRSDEDGQYSFEVPKAGRYRFSVGPDTQFQVASKHDIDGGPEHRIDFEMPTGVLAGRVLRADGTPSARHGLLIVHADADVDSRAFGDIHNTSTDSEGNFRVEGLPADRYYIRTGGWGMNAKGLGVRVADDIELSAGEEKTDIEIVVDDAAVIEGGILNADGSPAQGARVRLFDDSGNELFVWTSAVRTDYTGSYRFPNVGPGVVRMVAESEEGVSAETTIEIGAGETKTVVLNLGS